MNDNPETPAVWRPFLSALDRSDVLTLAPPGFGAAVPQGFGATYDEYVAWLVQELQAIGEPVDLVGHDWGANFSFRVACERPDLLRSWAIDTAGGFAPDYSFPDVSRVWQTPGDGEKAMANWLAMGVAERTTLNEALGMSGDVAAELAAAFDEPMTECILAVYRSVPESVLADLGQRASAAAARPGLVIHPTGDEYTGTPGQHQWLAEQAGAQVAVLEGLGHWWMLQDPAASAEALARFWGGLS
ncbi:MAG: alpha/beta fold hydrolase [Mycobacteriales bacterium]